MTVLQAVHTKINYAFKMDAQNTVAQLADQQAAVYSVNTQKETPKKCSTVHIHISVRQGSEVTSSLASGCHGWSQTRRTLSEQHFMWITRREKKAAGCITGEGEQSFLTLFSTLHSSNLQEDSSVTKFTLCLEKLHAATILFLILSFNVQNVF